MDKLNKYINSKPWISLHPRQSKILFHWNRTASKWRRQRPKTDVFFLSLPFFLVPAALVLSFYVVLSSSMPLFSQIIFLGFLHGWCAYSIAIYSLHECGAHRPCSKKWTEQLDFKNVIYFLSANFCRLLGADPSFYRSNHSSHHSQLGTEKDLTFTNWVNRRRFLKSICPGAPFLIKSDYLVHIGEAWTRSKVLTISLTTLFLSFEAFVLKFFWGWLPSICLLLLISPWVGNFLDRLRDSTEHFLRPSDQQLGSRDVGLGYYGWIVGGGPWGQAYHLTHHLLPSLPWYQQIVFGRRLQTLLRPEQRDLSTTFELLSKTWKASAL